VVLRILLSARVFRVSTVGKMRLKDSHSSSDAYTIDALLCAGSAAFKGIAAGVIGAIAANTILRTVQLACAISAENRGGVRLIWR
jgi:hypothetical protein